MKKLLILFILIILFCSLNFGKNNRYWENVKYSDTLTYTQGKIGEQRLKIYPNTIIYNSSGKFIINLSKENLSEEGQVFYGFGFMKGYGMGNDFNLFFEGTDSELVEWKYEHTDFIDIGQIGFYIHPGKILNDECDLNKFIDLSKVGSSVLIVSGEYKLKATRFLKDSTSSGKTEIIGKIYPEPFRLFVNMEGQLLAADIDVNPDKWNLNWFRMANNEGVFTVWIEKLPDNYSVKDIKQETILFNGVLKPTDIKIVGAEGKERMEIKFSKRDGISYIGYIESGDKKVINISGQFTDDNWFYGEKEIEITGKEEDNRYQKRKK